MTPGGGAPAPAALLRTTWSLAWPVIVSFGVESMAGPCAAVPAAVFAPELATAVEVGPGVVANATLFLRFVQDGDGVRARLDPAGALR